MIKTLNYIANVPMKIANIPIMFVKAMNKDGAINSFRKNINSLSRLPLITEPEMDMLFGEEVAQVLREISRLDRAEKICSNCRDRCCTLTKCELYTPRLNCCPIHDFRPVLCRLHFCARFHPENATIIRELGDIFVDSLIAAGHDGNPMVKWFDSPPLVPGCPELISAASPMVKEVENGLMVPEQAAKLILQEAEKHRVPVD
jgi:hypothetical protein